jgi:catechol 2,3-dioxygenase-like lactoylglutathione lyase family enzyme
MKIDHIVLTVRNMDRTCKFYSRALGLRIVKLRDGRKELQFGEQKIKVYEVDKGPELQAMNPVPGSLDICFVTTIALPHVVDHLNAAGIHIEDGPVRKMGAAGPIESIYVRDPDGNLVEIANYTEGYPE